MGALVLAACVGTGTARADTVSINLGGPLTLPVAPCHSTTPKEAISRVSCSG